MATLREHIALTKQRNTKVREPINRKPSLKCNDILGVLIIVGGIVLYSFVGILTRLSMLDKHSVSYNASGVIVLIELCKFIISFVLLITSEGIYNGIKLFKSISLNERLIFSIPAIIYSIANNLTFYELTYMDPGTLAVLSQAKILTISVLWWYIFAKHISKKQVVSLVSLVSGSILVAWPHNNDIDQMYITWPMGPTLLLLHIFLSSIACIVTEWIYKKYGKNRSVHIDNLSMYFWGIVANLLQYYYKEKYVSIINIKHILNNFNIYTYLLITVNIELGLCISFVLKYFNNVVKLMMYACSIIITGILTYIIFNLTWTWTYCIGLFAVIFGLLLFHNLINIIRTCLLLITLFIVIVIQNNYSITYKKYLLNESQSEVIIPIRNEITDKIFINCTFNNTQNYYQCPKGINYYNYFLHNDTYNLNNTLNCYWFKDDMFANKSFWQCDNPDPLVSIKSSNTINISQCAVVFVGGSLLLKRYGKEIDSHSEIFRFHHYPTKGHEQYVGNKTTIDVENLWEIWGTFVNSVKGRTQKQKTFLTFPSDAKDVSIFNADKYKLDEFNKFNVTVIFAENIFKECKAKYYNNTKGKKCSSGMLTLLFALRYCINVDLYGFSNDKCVPSHYFYPPKDECDKVVYENAVSRHIIQMEHTAIRNMSLELDNLRIRQ